MEKIFKIEIPFSSECIKKIIKHDKNRYGGAMGIEGCNSDKK